MFGQENCGTAYGSISCAALKRRLVELYTYKANLLIPYDEATYIVMKQDNGTPQSVISQEITAARQVMQEYYAVLDNPSMYLTYDSLNALRNDIANNALKKERIIKPSNADDAPTITIKNAKVYSVVKNPRWPGVIVMIYEHLEGEALFGVVYVRPDDLKNPTRHEFIEELSVTMPFRLSGRHSVSRVGLLANRQPRQ